MADLARRVARWRVPAGFAFGTAALWLSHPTRGTMMAGALVAAIGEAVRIWAAGHLEKGREVTTSGPYRWTRHPLYVGSSIMGAGLAIASASPIVVVTIATYLAVSLTAAIRTEEAHLTKKFGPAYPAYREGSIAAARGGGFSARRAMKNREYRACVGVLLTLALLTLKTVYW